MNSRRVFSRDPVISYTDYNNNKKGDEILKYIKSNDTDLVDRNFAIRGNDLTSFLDYDTFLNLSRSYFRNYTPRNVSCTSPMTVFDSAKSVLTYTNLLSHINNCNMCSHYTNVTDINECKEAKNILYPYGTTLEYTTNVEFPSKININNLHCLPVDDCCGNECCGNECCGNDCCGSSLGCWKPITVCCNREGCNKPNNCCGRSIGCWKPINNCCNHEVSKKPNNCCRSALGCWKPINLCNNEVCSCREKSSHTVPSKCCDNGPCIQPKRCC